MGKSGRGNCFVVYFLYGIFVRIELSFSLLFLFLFYLDSPEIFKALLHRKCYLTHFHLQFLSHFAVFVGA